MIIQGSPEILRGPRGLNGFGDFGAPEDSIQDLFKAVLGREGDQAGLDYFAERFGTSIEPGERAIFETMAQAEIQARNAYLAEQTALSAEAAVRAQNIALNIQIQQGVGEFNLLLASENARAAADEAAQRKFWEDQTAAINAQAAAAQAATAAANAAAATRQAEAVSKKAIADAYAAAQAASAAAAAATTLAAKQAADALRARALVVVKALYLQVLGREGDQAGLDYFADRFGDVIDPDELQVFSDMSKPEIDARNKYLADMAAKSKEDAAKAKMIADGFAATAAKAKAEAKTVVSATTGGGVNPMLILAAAAAAFFIGG